MSTSVDSTYDFADSEDPNTGGYAEFMFNTNGTGIDKTVTNVGWQLTLQNSSQTPSEENEAAFVMMGYGSQLTLDGSAANITVTADNTVGNPEGSNTVMGFAVGYLYADQAETAQNGAVLNFNADQTNITVSSTSADAPTLSGISAEGWAKVNVNGNMTIDVDTAANSVEAPEANAMYLSAQSSLTTAENTTLNISVKGTGVGIISDVDDEVTAPAGGFITGITTEGGDITANGNVEITAEANGGYASGLVLLGVLGDSSWVASHKDQIEDFGEQAVFHGDLSITATSNAGRAEAVRIGGFVPFDAEDPNEGGSYMDKYSAEHRVSLETHGTTTITAQDSTASVNSVGIFFALPEGLSVGDQYADVNLGKVINHGTMTVTGDLAVAGERGDLINEGTLTLNGDVDQFHGNFTQTAGETTLSTTNGKFFGGNVSVEGGALTAEDASLTLNANSGNLAVKNAALSMHTLSVEASQKLTLQNAEITAGFFNVETGVTVDAGGSTFVLNGNDDTDSHIDGTITNLGSIVVNNGTLDLDSQGYMGFVEGATVTLNGDALLSFTGTMKGGDLVFNDGTYLYTPEEVASDTLEIDGGKVDFNGNVHLLGGQKGVEADLEDTIPIKNLVLSHNPDDDEPLPEVTFNGGQYEFDGVNVEAGTLKFTGDAGDVSVTTFAATGGNAEVAGGTLHVETLNSTGAFTMNVSDGTFTVGKFVGAEGGAFTLASGTMQADVVDLTSGLLSVNGGATLSTFSGQLFTTALVVEGTNADAGELRYGTDHLSFGSGSTLTLRDEFYNMDYVNDAQGLLGGVHITLTGTEVDSEGQEVTEKPLDQMQEGTTQSTVTITADADESGTVTINSSVGGKELVVNQNTTKVEISSGETFTLAGSTEGGELITFQNEAENNTIAVSGGLTLGDTDATTVKTGMISTAVMLSKNAVLTSQNGNYTVSSLDAQDAQVNVSSGTLKVENLALSGTTSLTSGSNAVMELTNVTTEDGGTHQLKGEISAETVTGNGTLLVGSAEEENSASSTLAVSTLEHAGLIFIDPAWTDGAAMKDGSFLTVEQLNEKGELNAQVVAGQHSTFAFGATKDEAVKAFADTKLSYGQDKDVTAVLHLAKPVTVAGGSITVDGSLKSLSDFAAPDAGTVIVAKQGLAMFDGKAMEGLAEGHAVLSAKNVSFEEGSHIRFTNLTKDSTGTLIDADSLDLGKGVLEDAKSTNSLISVELTPDYDNGTLGFTTELKDAAVVFEGFKGAGLMNAMHEASANDTESNDRATGFLSRMAEHGRFGVESAADAVDIGNQAMALAATAGVYNVALDSSKLMNRSLERRMTLADNFDRTNGVTVWADVFGTTNQADSLYGDGGYDMDLYGGVLGADVEVVPGAVLGAALTVGTGDGGSKDAAIDVDNDADFFGLSVYGSHRIGNCNGMIDIGWMHTKSDLSATAFGMSIGDEVKADAFTIGFGAEHLMKFGTVNVVPHVGIRWTRLDVDGYEGAFKTDDDTMNIFTLPIGVAFSGNLNAGAWKLAPMVDLAVVPSFGDDEAESKVYWQGISETVKTQVVDDAPFQASLGINAQNGNWTIGASYDLGVGGDDRLDNAFSVRARYAF